jgi:hypothetical protein
MNGILLNSLFIACILNFLQTFVLIKLVTHCRAVYIRRKYQNKQLPSSTYLSEAEPFLEQYAKRSPANQALIGAAGDLVQTENFLAILDAQRDEEGDLQPERGTAPSSPTSTSLDVVSKTEGLIVFFPGKFDFYQILRLEFLDFE